jgi:hypothetical protein
LLGRLSEIGSTFLSTLFLYKFQVSALLTLSCFLSRTPCIPPSITPSMANVLQGGDGMMGGFPLEQWFYEMPVCTRWWMTAALSASVLVQCHIISPFQLFYSVRAVFFRSQVPPHALHRAYLRPFTNTMIVLAPLHHLLLLRPPQPRPPLPHLLPPTILAPPRRELRAIAGPFLMASDICLKPAALHSPHVFHGLPWLCAEQYANLHLEPEKPRHHAQLPRAAGLQGAISAMVGYPVSSLGCFLC